MSGSCVSFHQASRVMWFHCVLGSHKHSGHVQVRGCSSVPAARAWIRIAAVVTRCSARFSMPHAMTSGTSGPCHSGTRSFNSRCLAWLPLTDETSAQLANKLGK